MQTEGLTTEHQNNLWMWQKLTVYHEYTVYMCRHMNAYAFSEGKKYLITHGITIERKSFQALLNSFY